MTNKHSERRSRRRLMLLGAGSILDLQGMRTYERLRDEMPPVRRRPLNSSLRTATGYLTPLSSGSQLSSSRD